MATRTQPVPRISDRSDVADCLQSMLVELIDLGLEAKQAHWNVVGPFFAPLHAQYDTIAEDAEHWIDLIAERMTALDISPDGRARTIADRTPIPTFPEGKIKDRDSLELMTSTVAMIAERTRDRMEQLEEPDAATQDLVIEILQGLEKHLWMLRVQLA